MRLAIDGGAFQQGIAAGILNVAVGLLNALTRARPDISFVLVADPRLGPVREDLLDRLSARPIVIEAPVGPAYGTQSRHLTTTEPHIRFEVDGRLSEAPLVDGTVVYQGPVPETSFRILSRADSPSTTLGSGDTRRLGISIGTITVASGKTIRIVPVDHPALKLGFHDPEGDHRWTDGEATLPPELFLGGGSHVTVTVMVLGVMAYRLSGGVLDRSFAALTGRSARLIARMERIDLERRLRDLGVSAYIVNHFIPARLPTLPTYAILYDLIPILFPEFFMADARENFDCNVEVFKGAVHVFSISESSRTDLIEALKVDPDRVTTMSIDIDPAFARASEERVAQVRRRHGIAERPYVLTVGTLEPRKNHGVLIQAFGSLARSRQAFYDLVIVGKPGWGTESLVRQAAELGLEGRVHFLTGVPNEDLAALYSGALLLSYPSLYEGFGLPVLEAMACGCPVLTSDRSSMPEIAGEAAVLVDPASVGSVAQGLDRLASNVPLRTRLSEAGLARRHAFSWDASASRVLHVLERP